MLNEVVNKQLICSPRHLIRFVFVTIVILMLILFYRTHERESNHIHFFNEANVQYNQSIRTKEFFENLSKITNDNRNFETKIRCVGSLYNQSCLFENLYYFDSTFLVLTVIGSFLPNFAVRTDAFNLWPLIPQKREFNSSIELERFVRYRMNPMRIASLTLYFGQLWHHNIGHALFDGLYPAYVALIRFSPRHLYPFRILAGVDHCEDCWSEDVYSRFAGLGIIKQRVLNQMSKNQWFLFDEMIMGSGTLCQRCTQANLQLPGGIEYDASRLFRDRMYQQHSFLPSIRRKTSSAQYRTTNDILSASIIDNKRFTDNDRKELHQAMEYINNLTNSYLNQGRRRRRRRNETDPLIRVSYIYYHLIEGTNRSVIQINATRVDSRSPVYELTNNHFMGQLKLLREMDIHLSGPGTGQMYQTFLSDGSVHINLGGLRPWGLEQTEQGYTSYLEQHMTSGTPYIKGLYYPINERPKGIEKELVIQLIEDAAKRILQGFSLPVNPQENLGLDGQLFTEMCLKDPQFCSLVTIRSPHTEFSCLDLWIEDFIHEFRQWKLGGFNHSGRNIHCPFNHNLLHQLRDKYQIKHHSISN